jgi:hypothetical protein
LRFMRRSFPWTDSPRITGAPVASIKTTRHYKHGYMLGNSTTVSVHVLSDNRAGVRGS